MNRVAMPTLQTKRLKLVPFTPDHAPDVERYSGHWEVARYRPGITHPACSALAFARHVAFERRNGRGGLVYAISWKGQAQVVGLIGLNLTDDARSAEMGYELSPDARRQGIASEAAMAILDWGFRDADLDAIVARALVTDRASCRVLRKAGLRRIGDFRIYMPERRMVGLFEHYRLLRREWQP